jgi:hypothetical protein
MDVTTEQKIVVWSKKRRTLVFLNVILMSVILFALLVIVNLISKDSYIRQDITTVRRLCLSERTKDIISRLRHRLNIYYIQPAYALVSQREVARQKARERFFELIQEYIRRSELIKFKVVSEVNLEEYRRIVAKFGGMVLPNSILFVYQSPAVEKRATLTIDNLFIPKFFEEGGPEISFMGEHEITNTIYSLLHEKEYNFYFTQGHGEINILKPGKHPLQSMSALSISLTQQEKVNLKPLNILQAGGIPDDCDVLCIFSPKSAFKPEELEAISKYLLDGGRLFVSFNVGSDANLNKLLEKWGVRYRYDKILATLVKTGTYSYFMYDIVGNFAHLHEINSKITKDFRYLFSQTSFFQFSKPEYKGVTQKMVLSLSRKDGVYLIDYEDFRKGRDVPIIKLYAGHLKPAKEEMHALICSLQQQTGNRYAKILLWASTIPLADFSLQIMKRIKDAPYVEYILNNFRWLLEKETLHIPPRRLEITPLNLEPAEKRLFFFVAVLILPGFGIIVGFVTLILRRK